MFFRVKTKIDHTVWIDIEDAKSAEEAEALARKRVRQVLEEAFGEQGDVTGEAHTSTPLGVSWP
jgi:hypothetical protein